jgi:hypothetical protein
VDLVEVVLVQLVDKIQIQMQMVVLVEMEQQMILQVLV